MSNKPIKLAEDTITKKEILDLSNWLLSANQLTQGQEVLAFEKKWSKWLNIKNSIFVNSGSSANLIALYSLFCSGNVKLEDNIVVPALSWATDLAPVMQFGLNPILCDCNLDDLSVDLNHLEEIFINKNPKALILVSVLGLVPEMNKIVDLCKKYNVILIEDNCESTGSYYHGKKLGTFGEMTTFSFYYGHHMSTIEGGIVSTNSKKMSDILYSIRNHGWDRSSSKEFKNSMRKKWNTTEFDERFKFYFPGFNVRGTEINGKLGQMQLKTIDTVCNIRNKNFKYYLDKIPASFWKPIDRKDCFTSNFCYPIIHEKRDEIAKKLISKNIECRPLICGSMGNQPFYIEKYGQSSLENADIVENKGMYIPNHANLSFEDIDRIIKILDDYK